MCEQQYQAEVLDELKQQDYNIKLETEKVSMKEQLMISVDEAASILKTSARWVRLLCANKRINAIKVGNQWVVLDFNGYERTK